MVKYFKKILSRYADQTADPQQYKLVELYFDKLQESGVQSHQVKKNIGDQIKKKIDKKIFPRSKSQKLYYYKIAAAVVVFLSISLAIFTTYNKQQWIEQYAQRGQQLTFYLSDSTLVHLNANSKLLYPKEFDSDYREVKLTGEAFFEVKHTLNDSPFLVNSPKLKTRVLGTKFNVNDSTDETVQVSVYQGKVRVEDKISGEHVTLKKDQRVLYSSKGYPFEKNDIDSGQFNQWFKGEVKFDKMTIEEVLTVLNRRFDINLKLASKQIPKTTISGDFTYDKVEDILESLQFIYGITYKQEPDGVIHVYLNN
ncbi:FecR family protein [Myroides pelagicus]|uniref:DUF4974 domain-containing protein n=1 Tax=Myroides pelagicus TaxID=270914 RepID=A0A7K1GHX2_9FLAO|nr:FecR domain-containing protein [Myroides pelagicus]MEC4114126.1 FecR domain-containing protein [Myroides pelagicus]MTH28486.1 DUF4974 domain-containing protein [Myroides pelagicus]